LQAHNKRGGPIPTGCFSAAHSNKRKKYARQACSLFSSKDGDHVIFLIATSDTSANTIAVEEVMGG
jgi:hypothetical protein